MLQKLKSKVASVIYPAQPAAEISMKLKQDSDAQWQNLRGKTRNMIRKHEKMWRSICIGNRQIDAFYSLYQARMTAKRVNAKPYSDLLKLVKTEGIELYTEFDGIILKGGAIVDFRDKDSATWLVGCLTSEFLLWEVVKDCIRERKKILHFGRSRVGSGSYKFKKNFCGKAALIVNS